MYMGHVCKNYNTETLNCHCSINSVMPSPMHYTWKGTRASSPSCQTRVLSNCMKPAFLLQPRLSVKMQCLGSPAILVPLSA